MTETRPVLVRVLSVVLLGTTAACSAAAVHGPAVATSHETATVLVRVENGAFADVRVHAVMNEMNEVRLGTVGALTTRTLRIPAALSVAGSVRLRAQPIGGGETHRTELVRVQPGDTIVWQLANEARVSRFYIRQP